MISDATATPPRKGRSRKAPPPGDSASVAQDAGDEDFLARWKLSVEKHLEKLRFRADQTGNPLYAWEAISVCGTAGFPRHPIPEWCLVYLTTIATRLVTTGKLKKAEPLKGESVEEYYKRVQRWTTQTDITPAEAAEDVLRILGLGGVKGKSVFLNYRNDQLKMAEAIAAENPTQGTHPASSEMVIIRGRAYQKHAANTRVRQGRALLRPKRTT